MPFYAKTLDNIRKFKVKTLIDYNSHYYIFRGHFAIDEDVIKSQGIHDLDQYSVVPGTTDFFPDFFIPDDYEFVKPPKKVLSKNANSKL
jgi:hypothetical protein